MASIWYPTVYRDLHASDSVQMFPQFSFSGLGDLDKKYREIEKYRADLFLSKLDDPQKYSLVIECDGYEWYKDIFVEDSHCRKKIGDIITVLE